VADRPDDEAAALADFGMNLGIAFQLVDDALDYAADQAVLGKTVGDDFREGKITLPVLLAFQAADTTGRDFWRRTVEATEQSEADLDRALHLMQGCGAIPMTLHRAGEFATRAKAALEPFADSPLRAALRDVADYTVSRAR
jgi:octaprenyl-diphosphate synthase